MTASPPGLAACQVTRLDPVPLNQLLRLDDTRWEASGSDPYFGVTLPPGIQAGGIIRITADLDGDRLERPCVYFDTGSGWNEAGRVELCPEGPGCWSVVAPLARLGAEARFDPTEVPGPFRLHALRMERLEPGAVLVDLLSREEAGHPGTIRQVLAHVVALSAGQGLEAACAWMLSGGPTRLREPQGAYAAWAATHDTLPPGGEPSLRRAVREMSPRPLVSLVLPVPDGSGRLIRACIDSVRAQLYPDWELLIVGGQAEAHVIDAADRGSSRVRPIPGDAGDANTWNRALEAASGDYVWILDGAPVLPAHALMALADAIARHPGVSMVYADSDRIDSAARRHSPAFRPAWNPDLFLARDYVAGVAVLETRLLREAGGFRDEHAPAMVADLAIRCLGDGERPVVHLPLVLSHWPETADVDAPAKLSARRAAVADYLGAGAESVEAAACGGARIRWSLPQPAPKVSIVVPTRDRVDLLRQCVESILSRSTYPDVELLVVDNGSVQPETLEYLTALESRAKVRVLRYEQPFNYSAINNFAVAESSGEVIALVNNDIEVLTPDWLEEMVAHALRPGIGAVGAMLYYPDDTIQHAGVVVGLGGVAGHVYSRQPRGVAGEGGRAALAQNLSAVTAACLVVGRPAWEAVGGLDEALAVAFNDVDFCLRLREAGYRNLWTPHAELYHHESASRGREDTPEKLRRFHAEVAFMTARWGDLLADDPAYNPNLSLQHGAANELAPRPRSGLATWLRHMGVPACSHDDEPGCWTPR